jgi:hypothetical protein
MSITAKATFPSKSAGAKKMSRQNEADAGIFILGSAAVAVYVGIYHDPDHQWAISAAM